LQELVERLPTPDNRQFYLRLLFKQGRWTLRSISVTVEDTRTLAAALIAVTFAVISRRDPKCSGLS
jgi:hypothetical protein